VPTHPIEESLAEAEAAVRAGAGVAGTGFWEAVNTVKRHPELADRYADRIAQVEREVFRRWALVTVPLHVGTALMAIGTVLGVALVGFAYGAEGRWAPVILFYLGLGVLLVTTHSLAHLVAGTAMGIGFTGWFIGELRRPQPGVKLDYSSYLRAPARTRARMHAAGALFTKTVPFLLLGAAVAADLPDWAVWGVLVVGVGQIVTDLAWSTRASDWKKYRREMRFAQEP